MVAGYNVNYSEQPKELNKQNPSSPVAAKTKNGADKKDRNEPTCSNQKPSKSAERASKYQKIRRIVESNFDEAHSRKGVISPKFRTNTDLTQRTFG